MQVTGWLNRPISSPPGGQAPSRAVCGVAALAHSRAMGVAPRLASHPEKALARPRLDREQVLRERGLHAVSPNRGVSLPFGNGGETEGLDTCLQPEAKSRMSRRRIFQAPSPLKGSFHEIR